MAERSQAIHWHTRSADAPRRSGGANQPLVGDVRTPIDWHRRLDGYEPSQLVDAAPIAARLGLGRLWVKDESRRLGLPSYKILGASWAIYRTLIAHLGVEPGPWQQLEELRAWLQMGEQLELVAATDGNHGRAVAHVARLLGLDAHIYVPSNMVIARIEALLGEGANVTIVNGSYDDAVAASSRHLRPNSLLVSDTSWEGYEEIPRWVTDGYQTVFDEVDLQLAQVGADPLDAVAVQVGVGALAAAVAKHFRTDQSRTKLITVEPTTAACVLESLAANTTVEVPGPHDSLMAGLNCGLPSLICLPMLDQSVDLAVSVDDRFAIEAKKLLADIGVESGESGAAGLAGLLRLAEEDLLIGGRLGLSPQSSVLVINTEGVTDQN